MKITKTQLREIIREELQNEGVFSDIAKKAYLAMVSPLAMKLIMPVFDDAKKEGILNNKADFDRIIDAMEKKEGQKLPDAFKSKLLKKLKLK